MSNPTSNFGWQMPTNTDLVTDLPADFEVFGQAVDTDLADLNGGTTGQVLSKTSNTDLDFTWINNDVGDITGVTAGTGITGGGTSGTVTVTNSMATAITTNGDIIYGTGSGTFNRLGIGSASQVLSVTAGIPSWTTPAAAGAMTLLSTTTLSGTSTTISSINQTHNDLMIVGTGITWSSTNTRTLVKPNGVTTSGKYSGTEGTAAFASGDMEVFGTTNLSSDSNSNFVIIINQYASATYKPCQFYGGNPAGGYATNIAGHISTTTAISSIGITTYDGTPTLGGTIKIYGIK